MAEHRESETPIPTTENGQPDGVQSSITDDQYSAMLDLLNNIYDYRQPDGHDPSKLFHRKVNKRMVPDYYDVIKEPMAMSTIKSKLNQREYKDVQEFVRDWALISHNAQVYNVPKSGAYQDALVIKDLVQKELAKMVESKLITEEEAKMPFLGEIPAQEDYPMDDAEDDDAEGDGSEAEDEEDDEDDEIDDSDEESGKRRKRRGPRSTAAISKREKSKYKDDDDDPEARKKRGRPPRVDTPMEARIKEILKSMRKFKNSNNALMVYHFERLPDKATMPEYYAEVKNPIALDVIKKKLKRKKYNGIEPFMKDIELMFENAKSYNEDESQVYQDAVFLQKETRKIAEEVKKKPDSEFVMEDGRIPMPDGILHNGELWKVGDWVHIQNANDLTKPIVAQIYRTWQDTDGNKWVNACWYYRPEQTVHRYDRHFYENEVVKTGQYRDHPIEEVVDRCFVMFFTRYNKGRPRNFPADKEIYVCEARYNEEKHKLNKIKTWASCLPDEVRDKDYEMDLFDAPKKMKKVPSPIKYLFKEGEQKETDEMPKPVWGAPNAPPKIGAVHCRPRDPKDSPPPEPTPSPPPAPPPAPARSTSVLAAHSGANGFSADSHRPPDIQVPGPSTATPTPSHHPHQTPSTSYATSHYQQAMPSPAPMLQPMPPSASQYRPAQPPLTPSSSSYHVQSPASLAQQTSQATQLQYQNTFAGGPSGPTGYRPPQVNAPQPTMTQQQRYEAKPDPEVYYLPDHANNSIPDDIRRQFQCDAYGRVLFFTAPPVETQHKGPKLGHTAKYLAYKAERQAMVQEKKRQRFAMDFPRETQANKRAKSEDLEKLMVAANLEAIEKINEMLAEATVGEYQATFRQKWQEAMNRDLKALEAGQDRVAKLRQAKAERDAELEKHGKLELKIKGLTGSLEYAVRT
ncbi:uncharacterized protein PV09_07665 [Verruconis gallopava]|uniref:Bromodomain-containing protein n=1 Tax=Verruconis gallopava TaxID=253628 RepID=A0A0D1YJ63_9PEZI|nr:uncharacterized protein PV09_07665 [Verruconis gallopava]KIW00922.1 hypothetical protein PV09_07665 [Verruconis gallopava]